MRNMEIPNFFVINDWKMKRFAALIISIQLAFWGIIGLSYIGFTIPGVRQLIGFVYLTFIPGIMILRIFRLHRLGIIEAILHAIGLSISSIMIAALFANTFFPLLGISRPLSEIPLTLAIGLINLILLILTYWVDKGLSTSNGLRISNEQVLSLILFSVLLFLSFFGTYIMNQYGENILLIFLILISSLSVILILNNNIILREMYPLIILALSVSLLYHVSLISNWLIGYDIQREYYQVILTQSISLWDSTTPSNVNGVLSVMLLPIVYSNLCNLSIVWVFKIIYPLVFSIVPLGLYYAYHKQFGGYIAFLSCFFFISTSSFFYSMQQMAREEIAQIFFMLIIVLIVSEKLDKTKRVILLIIYSISLVLSHYGISYIFALMILSVFIISFFTNYFLKFQNTILTKNFLLLYLTMIIAWYMYVSNGLTFDTIVGISHHIYVSFYNDFLNPASAQGMDIITRSESSLFNYFLKFLYLISQFLITVGLFCTLFRYNKIKLNNNYILFSISSYIILLSCIAVPNFAINLNVTRLIQLMTFFLAPFSVIGGLTMAKLLNKLLKLDGLEKNSLRILPFFFAIFFIFNSGLLHEMLGVPCVMASSLNSTADSARFNEPEIACARWISKTYNGFPIFSDTNRWVLLNSIVGVNNSKQVLSAVQSNLFVLRDAYVFLGTLNVKTHIFYFVESKQKYVSFDRYLNNMDKIYDSNCNIYINRGANISSKMTY